MAYHYITSFLEVASFISFGCDLRQKVLYLSFAMKFKEQSSLLSHRKHFRKQIISRNFDKSCTQKRARMRRTDLLWRSFRSLFLLLSLAQSNAKMPSRCILPTCGNKPNKEKNIALHKIPFYNDDRDEAKRRRKKWIDYIDSKGRIVGRLQKTRLSARFISRQRVLLGRFFSPDTPQD